ncbi:MAG: sialidase family protein [Opitutaceae bacterium]|nr:sialidase family protein [Opitutaceae bacterium]
MTHLPHRPDCDRPRDVLPRRRGVRAGRALLGAGWILASVALAAPADPGVFRKVVRRQGDDGVHAFRIPGLATTPKGTLIAAFNVRHGTLLDLPADADIAIMRSTDDGTTWSPMKVIIDFDKNEPGSMGNGVGDPCVLVDRQTGTILVAGLNTRGAPPGKTAAQPLLHTLVLTKSVDDGLTWSPPVDITPQVQHPDWKKTLVGPGAGIQLRDGTLVIPAQYQPKPEVVGKRYAAKTSPDADALEQLRIADRELPKHACFIYSRDGGKTWKTSPTAIPGDLRTSEAQAVELADGSLLLSIRNHDPSKRRVWSRYRWQDDIGAGKWSEPWFVVPDPTCQASLLRHPSGVLLFSNPNSPTERVAMTVRASHDDGRTWNEGRLVDGRKSGYSCMTLLRDGRIGLLYEGGDVRPPETLTFVRFPLSWITAADAAAPKR